MARASSARTSGLTSLAARLDSVRAMFAPSPMITPRSAAGRQRGGVGAGRDEDQLVERPAAPHRPRRGRSSPGRTSPRRRRGRRARHGLRVTVEPVDQRGQPDREPVDRPAGCCGVSSSLGSTRRARSRFRCARIRRRRVGHLPRRTRSTTSRARASRRWRRRRVTPSRCTPTRSTRHLRCPPTSRRASPATRSWCCSRNPVLRGRSTLGRFVLRRVADPQARREVSAPTSARSTSTAAWRRRSTTASRSCASRRPPRAPRPGSTPGSQTVIGVNKYQVDEDHPIEVLKVENSRVRAEQLEKLARLRADRDEAATTARSPS